MKSIIKWVIVQIGVIFIIIGTKGMILDWDIFLSLASLFIGNVFIFSMIDYSDAV